MPGKRGDKGGALLGEGVARVPARLGLWQGLGLRAWLGAVRRQGPGSVPGDLALGLIGSRGSRGFGFGAWPLQGPSWGHPVAR